MHLSPFTPTNVFSFLLLQCKGVKQRVDPHLCCSYPISHQCKRRGKATRTALKCTGFQDLWGEYEKKSEVIRPRTLLDPGNQDGKYWLKHLAESQCRNGSSPRNKQVVCAQPSTGATHKIAAEKTGKIWPLVLREQLILTLLSAPPIKIKNINTQSPPFAFVCVQALWSCQTAWCWGSRY